MCDLLIKTWMWTATQTSHHSPFLLLSGVTSAGGDGGQTVLGCSKGLQQHTHHVTLIPPPMPASAVLSQSVLGTSWACMCVCCAYLCAFTWRPPCLSGVCTRMDGLSEIKAAGEGALRFWLCMHAPACVFKKWGRYYESAAETTVGMCHTIRQPHSSPATPKIPLLLPPHPQTDLSPWHSRHHQ